MGSVYRARQLSVDRDVAVKVLRADLEIEGELLERFEAEAKIISNLRDPHTLKLIDFGKTEEGVVYLVTELLTGRPLSAEIARGPLGQDRTVELLVQLSESLEEAHSAGIVHRDLKPHNLFLETVAGRTILRVLDFGIAKTSRKGFQTHSGAVFGTPAYMSPEQTKGARVGPASDLYAVGVIAFECLTGRPPFVADDPLVLMMKHASEPPPPLPAGLADRRLEGLIARLLEKNPARRPASASALRDELRSAVEGPTLAPTLLSKIDRPPRRFVVPTLIASVVALSLLAGLLLRPNSGESPEARPTSDAGTTPTSTATRIQAPESSATVQPKAEPSQPAARPKTQRAGTRAKPVPKPAPDAGTPAGLFDEE